MGGLGIFKKKLPPFPDREEMIRGFIQAYGEWHGITDPVERAWLRPVAEELVDKRLKQGRNNG